MADPTTNAALIKHANDQQMPVYPTEHYKETLCQKLCAANYA
jgi:hypothetical protein